MARSGAPFLLGGALLTPAALFGVTYGLHMALHAPEHALLWSAAAAAAGLVLGGPVGIVVFLLCTLVTATLDRRRGYRTVTSQARRQALHEPPIANPADPGHFGPPRPAPTAGSTGSTAAGFDARQYDPARPLQQLLIDEALFGEDHTDGR